LDDARYRPREYRTSDYPTEADLRRRIFPDRPSSPEHLRRQRALLAIPPSVLRPFVVEETSTGQGIGFAVLATEPDTLDPTTLWAGVTVDPDHRGRGVGRYLADAVDEEAGRLRARLLWAKVRAEDARSRAFAERRGFVECRRSWTSRLDLPAVGYHALPQRAERLARDGITFTTLAEEGAGRREVLEGVHRAVMGAMADEPRTGTFTPTPFELFAAEFFDAPGFLPEAFFLAKRGDEYVGVSNLERSPDDPALLRQMFTGTLRSVRGRGIATELKRRTVEYAQSHGYRTIRTGNDSLNHPMWAINAKLGFRREVETIQYERTLEPGAER
jgi:mycothiol synthase